MPITVTMEIPEELAAAVTSGGRDLSHAALEALAVEAYRAKRLSDSQFRRLLWTEPLGSRWSAQSVRCVAGLHR